MADKNNNLATLSETGKRKNNEDRVLGQISPNGATGPRVIIAVADGMGGLEAGEVASKTIHDMLFKLHQGGLSGDYHHIHGRIKDCIKTANHNIYEWSQKKAGIQMGTTVSGAVILGNRYLVFNIGDSRTYLIRKEGIKQVTTDHSVDTEAFQAGLIKKEEIGKGAYSNALTRTVGTDPHVDVDIFPHGHFGELTKGDIFFCCTDGLWGRVKDDDIRREIMARSDFNKSLEFLYRLAYKNGSKDNISMAAYRYGDFTGGPAKPEKSGSKAPQVKEKNEKEKRKIKISLPVITIVLIPLLVVIVSLLSSYINVPTEYPIPIKKTGQEQIEKKITPGTTRTPLTPGKIFEPTTKRDTTATRTTPQANDTREEQKPPAPNNYSQDVKLTPVQPTTMTTSLPTMQINKNNRAQGTTGTKTTIQSTTPKPIEIMMVSLSQLDSDIRANIEAKFKKITVEIGGITGITKKGDSQAIIALDSNGEVRSIDIKGVEVKPKEKMAEFKSNLAQRITSMNFPSPTINGRSVNAKIVFTFKNVGFLSNKIIIFCEQ